MRRVESAPFGVELGTLVGGHFAYFGGEEIMLWRRRWGGGIALRRVDLRGDERPEREGEAHISRAKVTRGASSNMGVGGPRWGGM